jgi:hypothetical protein
VAATSAPTTVLASKVATATASLPRTLPASRPQVRSAVGAVRWVLMAGPE